MMKTLLILVTVCVFKVWADEAKFDCSNWRKKLDDEGNIIFIAGDRGYVPPETLTQLEPLYCQRQTTSLEKIRNLARNCMKPFPRQVVGLMTYGSRKDVKALCKGPVQGKQELLDNNVCFRNPAKMDQLHDAMDSLILKYETIRDNVYNESLKLPHICCAYASHLDNLKTDFRRICGTREIDYWIDMTERKLDDSLDIMCSGYRRGAANSKCIQFKADNPLIVPANKKRQSVSIVLALVDILSQLATEDDGQYWSEKH